MASRVLIRDRIAYTNRSYFHARRPDAPTDRDGRLIELGAPVPADSAESPFREGEAWTDPEDGLTYRVLGWKALDPKQGWGSLSFWLRRWKTTPGQIYRLVELGILDAAMEVNSALKRFRCRDEQRARAELPSQRRRRRRRRR